MTPSTEIRQTFLQWMRQQRGKPELKRNITNKMSDVESFLVKQNRKEMSGRVIYCLGMLSRFSDNEFLKAECKDLIQCIETFTDKGEQG